LIAADAPKADMACRGVDQFEMTCSRAMGPATVEYAEMQPAPLGTLRGIGVFGLRESQSAAVAPPCGRANIMQTVNRTVQSRKCLMAIMLTYSLWRCNKHRNRSYNYAYNINSPHLF